MKNGGSIQAALLLISHRREENRSPANAQGGSRGDRETKKMIKERKKKTLAPKSQARAAAIVQEISVCAVRGALG